LVRLNLLSIVGGILGIISLVLPWFFLSFTAFGFSISTGVSGIQILAGLGGLALQGGMAGGAGMLLLIVGVFLVLAGSIVAFLHPAGGLFTLGGGVAGLAGAFLLSRELSGLFGSLGGEISAGPSVGVFLALVAGILSLVGFRVQIPTPGPPRPAGYAYPYPYPVAPVVWQGIPASPPAPAEESGPMAVCPQCGARAHAVFCLRDGTPMEPAPGPGKG